MCGSAAQRFATLLPTNQIKSAMKLSTLLMFTYVSVLYFSGVPCLTEWMAYGMTFGYVLFVIYALHKAAVEQYFEDQENAKP